MISFSPLYFVLIYLLIGRWINRSIGAQVPKEFLPSDCSSVTCRWFCLPVTCWNSSEGDPWLFVCEIVCVVYRVSSAFLFHAQTSCSTPPSARPGSACPVVGAPPTWSWTAPVKGIMTLTSLSLGPPLALLLPLKGTAVLPGAKSEISLSP